MTMRAYACALIASLLLPSTAPAAEPATLTPEQLLDAVDQMTPDQAYTLQETLEAKLWQPVPRGFFSRMSFLVQGYAASIDDPGAAAFGAQVARLDLDEAGGSSGQLLWQLFHPRLHLGLGFDAWQAEDSDLGPSGYTRAELTSGAATLVASYEFVREPAWSLRADCALGGAGAELELVDTPAGQPTTMRELDADYLFADLGGALAWRFNPVLSLFVSAGWRIAEDADWEEGDREQASSLDASGYRIGIGLSINY